MCSHFQTHVTCSGSARGSLKFKSKQILWSMIVTIAFNPNTFVCLGFIKDIFLRGFGLFGSSYRETTWTSSVVSNIFPLNYVRVWEDGHVNCYVAFQVFLHSSNIFCLAIWISLPACFEAKLLPSMKSTVEYFSNGADLLLFRKNRLVLLGWSHFDILFPASSVCLLLYQL